MRAPVEQEATRRTSLGTISSPGASRGGIHVVFAIPLGRIPGIAQAEVHAAHPVSFLASRAYILFLARSHDRRSASGERKRATRVFYSANDRSLSPRKTRHGTGFRKFYGRFVPAATVIFASSFRLSVSTREAASRFFASSRFDHAFPHASRGISRLKSTRSARKIVTTWWISWNRVIVLAEYRVSSVRFLRPRPDNICRICFRGLSFIRSNRHDYALVAAARVELS